MHGEGQAVLAGFSAARGGPCKLSIKPVIELCEERTHCNAPGMQFRINVLLSCLGRSHRLLTQGMRLARA